MRTRTPGYCNTFHCLAGACPDTCCKDWQLVIDDDTFAKYAHLPEKERTLLNQVLVKTESEQYLDFQHKPCPFLTDDSLCALLCNYDASYLCFTCRTYPRYYYEYGSLLETGISMSCPEAARIILSNSSPVCFTTTIDNRPVTNYNDIDADLFFCLQDARQTALTLMQDMPFSSNQRLALLLTFAYELQQCFDQKAFDAARDLLHRYQNPTICRRTFAALKKQCLPVKDQMHQVATWFSYLLQLEHLTTTWEAQLQSIYKTLHNMSAENQNACFSCTQMQNLENFSFSAQQIVTYFLTKYFLTAAYDGEILQKTKICVFSYLVLQIIAKLHWEEQQGCFSLEDQIALVHLYCREIEHSDDNLHALYQRMQNEKILSSQNLLSWLLN